VRTNSAVQKLSLVAVEAQNLKIIREVVSENKIMDVRKSSFSFVLSSTAVNMVNR
jgi:hypothetical protein